MEHKPQDVKSSLGNNITIALFLIITMWGILITTIIQTQLKNILLKEKLADNIIENINRQFVSLSTGITILGMFAVLCVAFVFSKKITKTIKQLTKGVREVAAGNLDTKLEITSQDEIGQLAHSFNKMTEDLKSSTTSIVNLNKEIAERKQAEQTTASLNKQLEKINTELKDFVYIASHDLREPLRKISSFGELLKNSLTGKLEADDLENFEFMIDGADRMTKMIEGLLVYSRLSKDSESFTAVDLNELVEQLKQLELNILLEETGTTIEVSDNMPKVFGDEVQLKQLLQNLISNGIKYRAKDVQPRITITAEQVGERKVKVEVRDNGIGIEEKYYNDVFKMFRRLHSRQEYEGTGIGLAVCKKIIDKHHGQIGVESEAGKGSTFWFILPMAAAEQQESNSAVSSAAC